MSDTVRYSLLCDPAKGRTTDNTITVRLDVSCRTRPARPHCEGPVRCLERLRRAVPCVELGGGRVFEWEQGFITAEELADAMASPRLRAHAPELVDGAEILATEPPWDRELWNLSWLVGQLVYLTTVDLDYAWDQSRRADGSFTETVAFVQRGWAAWREALRLDELMRMLEARMPVEMAERHARKIGTGGAHVVAWPRDADRVPAIARIVAEVFEEHSEPRALFEALQARLPR